MYNINKTINDSNIKAEYLMNEELEDYVEKLNNLSSIIVQITSKIDTEAPSVEPELINDLFRNLHTLKAATHYHHFDEIAILFEKTEDVIFFIRNYKCCFNNSVNEWFDNLIVQIDRWVVQIQNDEEPEYYALNFETSPIVQCANYISPKLNEIYEIVILNKDTAACSLLVEILQSKFKFVDVVETIKEAVDILSVPGKKILITDLKFPDGNIIDLMTELDDIEFNLEGFYILSKFSKEASVQLFKDKLHIDTVFNLNTTKMSELKKVIVQRLETNDSDIEIPINNKISLVELAQSIEPLPDTLIALKEACFNEKTEIRDIVKIIENDPMFTAIILREINSPYIGLSNRVSKISIAVSLLGKKQIGGMTIVEVAKSNFTSLELEAYSISLVNLIEVSKSRIQFVTEWLKYIDMEQDNKDDIISLMHLLPLGILISNQALLINESANKFVHMLPTTQSLLGLETSLLGFNNLDALEKLFSIWSMPPSIKAIIPAIREKGQNRCSRTIELQGHIVNLAMKMFKYDGHFIINKAIIRYAENRKLAGHDMKNIFLEITNNKTYGNLLD